MSWTWIFSLGGFLGDLFDWLLLLAGIVLIVASYAIAATGGSVALLAGPAALLAGPVGKLVRIAGVVLLVAGSARVYADHRVSLALDEYRATVTATINAERDRQQAAAVAELQQQHAAEIAALQATAAAKTRIANVAPPPAACRLLPAGRIALDELRARADSRAGAIRVAPGADHPVPAAKPAP